MGGVDLRSGPARRRAMAGGVVAAAILALTAVVALASIERSGGDVLAGTDPVEAVRSAPQTIGGARLHARSTVGTTGALQVQVAQEGTVDLRADRTDLTVTGIGGGKIRVVTNGPVVYLQAGVPLGGKPWGRLTGGGGPGGFAGSIGQGGTQVGTMLSALGSVTSVSDRGVEQVDGTRVRHLSGTIPARSVAAVSPLFAQVGATADAAVEVYLDAQGRPRRIVVNAAAGATTVQLAATLSDFGTPPAVTVPPEGEVADIGVDDLAAVLAP